MSFINIHVASQAHLSVKNNQLVLTKEGEQIDYPLEDVSSVMIENLQTSISTYTLSKLAQNNVVTYICDEKHMPCACVLPFIPGDIIKMAVALIICPEIKKSLKSAF